MKTVLCLLLLLSPLSLANESNPYVEFRTKTYEIQEEYLKQITNHQSQLMGDLEEKLEQQKWQTNAIAVMVYIMVAVGLLLSYLQFRRDGQTGSKSSVSLKIGSGNLEINSSVIGLVILAMSFWFFQTYIDRVYSVEILQIAPIDATGFGINQ